MRFFTSMRVVRVFILVLIFNLPVRAQSVVDPNVWIPKIGVDIDTIYGHTPFGEFGAELRTLPPAPGERYGRPWLKGLTRAIDSFSTLEAGPDFDLHNLKVLHRNGSRGFGSIRDTKPTFHSIRNSTSKEMIQEGLYARIQWSDQNGDYDSSRVTILDVRKPDGFKLSPNAMRTYITHMSSDTVEDVLTVAFFFKVTEDTVSAYLNYYKGGQSLYDQGARALPDSTVYIGSTNTLLGQNWNCLMQGDWRGTGREDMIAINEAGDAVYYKNKSPFSLSDVVRALKEDTIWTRWENDGSRFPQYYGHPWLTANIVPKSTPGKDLAVILDTILGTSYPKMFIFKGGPDFGSRRLTRNSAEMVIPHPGLLEAGFQHVGWGATLRDCGDMTGTGNRVISTSGPSNTLAGYYFFYVTGKALDDKIDMFFRVFRDEFSLWMDTITADDDGKQDLLMGLPAYETSEDFEKGKENLGTIFLLKGSNKIPVNLNPRYAVERPQLKGNSIAVKQHERTFDVTFDWSAAEEGQLRIYSVLGIRTSEMRLQLVPGKNATRIELPSLSRGAYLLTVTGANNSISGSFIFL
jgi:hypothetical protein